MNTAKTRIAPTTRKLILAGIFAVVVTTVACSRKTSQPLSSSSASGARLRPAVLQIKEPDVSQPSPPAAAQKTSAKPSASKLVLYRSRDYGVSFAYPWQYGFVSAKTVAENESLRPKSDGDDGQFTLARIEIPKGFYADTDYQSGYFALSLNQDLEEEKCNSILNPDKDGKVGTESINDVEFHWLEIDSGGHGEATKLRRYVTFTNDTCYELELGVNTRNEDGLAREINPDLVLRRLDTVLRTVKILPVTKNAGRPVVENSTVPQQPALPQQSEQK